MLKCWCQVGGRKGGWEAAEQLKCLFTPGVGKDVSIIWNSSCGKSCAQPKECETKGIVVFLPINSEWIC